MLAKADIVFAVDESVSESMASIQTWLGDSVVPQLQALGIDDVKYGLVGFVWHRDEFAHSYLINSSGTSIQEKLFGSRADLETAISNEFLMHENAALEDGWDAIDHALAEYDFRTGAVPILVLVQNQEGRNVLNRPLTREGLLATLDSKNVILNVMTVGSSDGSITPPPVFDLSKYGQHTDIRVLGVEADLSESDTMRDGRHACRWVDTEPGTGASTTTSTTSQALQASFDGSNTGAVGMVGAGKSILFSKTASSGLGPVPRDATDYRATSVDYRAETFTGTATTAGDLVTIPLFALAA